MLRVSFDPEQRRLALRTFIATHSLRVLPWCEAAGLAEATLRGFLAGRTRTLSDETYELLADAASSMLERQIHASDLRAEPLRSADIPVAHYVGAGDEIHIFDGDEPLDYVGAPPGYEKGAAGIVRGVSGAPFFEDGDVIFWRELEAPPKDPPRRPVVVKVKDGPVFLKKLLPGSRRGRYHLISINPATAPLLDQQIESMARIGWHNLKD